MKVLSKKELRNRIRSIRRSLSADQHQALSQKILEHIKTSGILNNAELILAFCPFDGEPDISPILDEILRSGKDLVLPKVVGDGLKLCKVRFTDTLSMGSFCILEPAECEEVDPEKVELALVPGVAFDRRGCRLGMGKGYYDRILGKVRGLKVGVAFSFQVFEEIPCDPWDQKVDAILTEKGIFYRR
ncbi:5-formyltetrahydrofolate cyclo-ligase [Thermocrinis sp.]|uniref:5-formyltetrahydrofolate cyclo-ligase n=1 Tax=Thermocrinis sp. TaxID=2024383 RepID=UPI002FDD5843